MYASGTVKIGMVLRNKYSVLWLLSSSGLVLACESPVLGKGEERAAGVQP